MAEDWGYESDIRVMDRLIRFEKRFIVDVGCGAGDLCRVMAKRGAHVLGVEPHPEQAADNKRAPVTPNVGFAQAGAAEIPVEPGSVDGLVFSNSFHHIPQAHYPMVAREMMRVLKPQGFAYVLEPVANGTSQHVMAPFHDETEVRLAAYNALVKEVEPRFSQMREATTYSNVVAVATITTLKPTLETPWLGRVLKAAPTVMAATR